MYTNRESGEFVNSRFTTYEIENGITHYKTCPYSSEQNEI